LTAAAAAPTQTLTDELATLEATLEGLRTAASTAKEDLRECHEYLVEAHRALGLDMDPAWNDIDSDLTARRRDQFHAKKAEMKEELSTRTAAVVQLLRDCQQLMDDLRMEPETDGSDLERRIAASLVRSKDGSFIMASKFRSETCVGISSKALEELTRHVAVLHKEKRRRKEKLQEMGAEIAVLWEKLRIPEKQQRAFTQSVQGLGLDTMEKGENELQRLHAMKSAMLGKLIVEARETIANLWEQTNANSESTRSFSPYHVQDEDLFDDDLLEKHEAYIEELQERLEQMRPIIRLIERREVVVRERIEYEELQKDPERLQQRGAAMTKQLMAEEKMAKRNCTMKIFDSTASCIWRKWTSRKHNGSSTRRKRCNASSKRSKRKSLLWIKVDSVVFQRADPFWLTVPSSTMLSLLPILLLY
jgi:Ase1/PRC1/MAP65 family protein